MAERLPWFEKGNFPIYLAPMAGVTDTIFRKFCKQFGADVMVTEFVSAEGILHRNRRTSDYLEFDEFERPLGVQLFGADPEHLADAAQAVIDWVRPDFIDLNFGCPVNKVVCKNGGSSLLRDMPLLERVARTIVERVAPFPVTAKIRIGWCSQTINAVESARRLEGAGIRALAVHGRTRSQGYSGQADWRVIAEVKASVRIPVIGNGDINSASDVARRRAESGVDGIMIGRAAMSSPWIFAQTRALLDTGTLVSEPDYQERWDFIRRHCAATIARVGDEDHAMRMMRGRLMAYSRGMPGGKFLRSRFSEIASIEALDAVRTEWSAAFHEVSTDCLAA